MADARPYDPTSAQSILAYAERLIGRSLRDVLDELPAKIEFSSNKGGWGTALERHYFRYAPNNRPEPDFAEAGIELKATPLKQTGRGRLVAKERLVLGNIDYQAIISEEWAGSSFVRKNSHLLIVFYLHEKNVDPRDFVVRIVRLWEFPPEDLAIIRRDWEAIRDKVRAGLAHEISEGDTLYLGACVRATKGTDRRTQPMSTEKARRRAFSLKQAYMNAIIDDSLVGTTVAAAEVVAGLSFEEVVTARFEPYIGMTADEIAARLDVCVQQNAKGYFAAITKRVLGAGEKDDIAEFKKAGIEVKTIRLLPSGRPKEDVSFPAFDYCELIEQHWDSSDLREQLGRRFFFVIYQLDAAKIPRLLGTRFWTMPMSDVEGSARACFLETQGRVREDRAEYLPRKSENPVCHVRPHGRDSSDTIPAPSGRLVCRKSFWLNGSYIREQLGL